SAHVTLTNDNTNLGTLSAAFVNMTGASDSNVTFTGANGAAGTAHLHASFGGVTKDLDVAVFTRSVASVPPPSSSVAVGATDVVTVALDSAVPTGGLAVVAVSPSGGAGTARPSSVTVAPGQTSANVTFNATAAGTATIT